MPRWPALLIALLVTVVLRGESLPPEAKQFDFWLGDWRVSNPDGQIAGDSRIERVADGWGVLEHWTGVSGVTGKSLNTWLPGAGRWRQLWVGTGGALELTGGLNAAGEMVLTGRSPASAGGSVLERITWSPKTDGTVRQRWEQSSDGGRTWTIAFDGLYRRKVG